MSLGRYRDVAEAWNHTGNLKQPLHYTCVRNKSHLFCSEMNGVHRIWPRRKGSASRTRKSSSKIMTPLLRLRLNKKERFYVSNQDWMHIGPGGSSGRPFCGDCTKSTGSKNSGGEKKSPGIQWFPEKLFCWHCHVVSSKAKCHISVPRRPQSGERLVCFNPLLRPQTFLCSGH